MKRFNRRSVLRMGASLGALGLPWFSRSIAEATTIAHHARPANRVLFLWLDGAPSTIDMWDMKPNAPSEVRGEFKPIATNVPGIQICEHMPRLSKCMDNCTIIRSMHHGVPEHGPGSQWMLTGRSPSAATSYPAIGSLASRILTPARQVPSYVAFGKSSEMKAGYLGSAYDAFEMEDGKQPVGLSLGEVTTSRFVRKEKLLQALDSTFDVTESDRISKSMKAMRSDASDVLRSDLVRRMIDISESDIQSSAKDFGIQSAFGRNAYRACRLLEAGARFVSVGLSGWDTHVDNFSQLRTQLLPQLDMALAGSLDFLKSRGLLDETIVCVAGEFGRTPSVNNGAGRDHWSRSFSVLVAGGGFAQGACYGETDEAGNEPVQDACTPGDLYATMLQLLGVDPVSTVDDITGRPMRIMDHGTVLSRAILA
ncbi:MAG: DUF1501 domain-containing protein [Pirellula sp.]